MASSLASATPRFLGLALSALLVVTGLTTLGSASPAAAVGPVAGSTLVMPASVTDKIAASHPYLLAKSTDWTRIKSLSTTDAKAKDARARVLTAADAVLPQAPQQYVLQDASRILDAARVVKDRVYLLGSAYQLTGDAKYAQRGYQEMASAASWVNWNPSHFLDTAELTNGLGIGYDWFYSYMTPEQRTVVRTAIITKGLQPGLSNYREPVRSAFVNTVSNWNNVSNGGMIVGALAIAKEEKALSEEVLQYALPSTVNGLKQWGPDGGYAEGIGYWNYAMQYTAVTLSALNSATGSDFGLSQEPGLSKAANFPIYTMSNAGGHTGFNYGDDYPSQPVVVENLYLGKLYNNPVYTFQGHKALTSKTADPKALIWYDPALPAKSPAQAGMAPDAYFRNTEVVTMRGGWDSTQALFAGIKAASGPRGHADLDLGSFVFTAMGEAWATDLGRDDYTYIGGAGEAARWEYYRKRAEGQNTLVFNSETRGTAPDADPAGYGVFQKFFSAPTDASAITDLSKAAPNDVKSWKRGMALYDNKSQLLIQDEVLGQDSLKSAWWFMHTDAGIEVAADGRSAVLTKEQNGKPVKVLARLISSNTSLTFTSMAAKALPTSPNALQEMPLEGRKLAINIAGIKDFTLGVQLTPLTDPTVIPKQATLKPLAQWSSANASPPTVASIKLNGVALPDFSPTTANYDVTAYSPQVPVVTADKKNSTDVVTITQAPTTPGRAKVTVQSGIHGMVYYINFRHPDMPIPGATASTSSATETPYNSTDGNPNTRWAFYNKAGGWLQYDLGSVKPIPTMDFNWRSGRDRVLSYTVETSSDAKTWTNLTSKNVTGATAIDTIPVNRTARYVKITMVPGQVDPWVGVQDVRFYTPLVPSAAPGYVHSVDFALPTTSLELGESLQLAVNPFTKAKTPVKLATGSTTTYTSSNPNVATVTAAGVVTAVAAGTTKLSATVYDPAGRTTNWTSTKLAVNDPTKVSIPSSADTWVNGGDNIDRNFGTVGQLSQKNVGDGGGSDRASFMAFDLPPTPAGMKIGTARLLFTAGTSDSNGTAIKLTVAPTLTPFEELKTTWRTKPALGEVIASTDVDGTLGQRTIVLTDYLRKTMGAGGQKLSLGFGQQFTSTRFALNTYIHSREASATMQPRLEVEYIPEGTLGEAPPATIIPVADTWANGGANAGKVMGATAADLAQKSVGDGGGSDRAAYMQFRLPLIPEGYRIASAKLSFMSRVDDGNGTTLQLNAHEVAGAIDEKTLTWLNKPALGPKVADTITNNVAGLRTMDLTAYAQKVVSSDQSTMSLGFSQTLTTSRYYLNTYIAARENVKPPTLDITYEPIP